MNELYEKIYNLFLNEVKKEDILYEMNKAYQYIENMYFEYFNFEYETIYHLKDLLWYNVEHLSQSDVKYGLTNLSTIGSKFKIINQIENNVIINIEEIKALKDELIYIKNNWNSEWKIARLYSEDKEIWSKEDNVIIHDKTESPRKYNYYKKTSILNNDNKNMYLNKDVVLCEIDSKLGDYYLNNIMYDCILNLFDICNNCINDNKYLIFKGVN